MRRALAVLLAAVATDAATQSTPVMGDGIATPIERPPPKYPAAAAKQGVDGCVVVSFLIDAQGHPRQVEVVEANPKGRFEKATLEAMKQWRFEQPAREGRYGQALQFQIKGREQQVNTCAPVPSFAALNPGAPPQARQVKVLQAFMPAFAAQDVDSGCVTLRFRIRHDGFVADVAVLEARPASLAEPAVEAIRQWVFSSFPPPDLYATQTFYYQPDLVKLPDDAIRESYATADAAQLTNVRCGDKPSPVKPGPVKPGAKG